MDLVSLLGQVTGLHHKETASHNLRVTIYTLQFAETLALSHDEIVRTVKGAMLHDVGKLAVPDHILGKPGKLTPEECVEMTMHVRYGLEIISQSVFLQDALPVVGAHHERYDGTGYPSGLKGQDIPREARLFASVDVFDALTSSRSYKPAIDVNEALETMASGRGSHFDPVLFDHFVEHARGFAQALPQGEAALAECLTDKLLPYFGYFVRQTGMAREKQALRPSRGVISGRNLGPVVGEGAANPS